LATTTTTTTNLQSTSNIHRQNNQTNKQTKRPKTKQQNLEGRKGEEKKTHTKKPKSILPIALLGKHKLIEESKHDHVVVLMINLFIYVLFCLHYFV